MPIKLNGATSGSVTLKAPAVVGGDFSFTLPSGATDLSAAWTAYTPTVAGTGWAIGNGTATGAYMQIGKTVHYRALIAFGSTSTYGTAAIRVGLPVSPIASACQVTTACYVDWSASALYVAATYYSVANSAVFLGIVGSSGLFTAPTSTTPFTWTTTDEIRIAGTYEAA
jgi:hypothetical protein